eukprot:11359826-Alexandrium_andersonii.AAC.1
MSASLVGSEMCIRDRLSAQMLNLPSKRPGGCAGGASWGHPGGWSPSQDCLLYTSDAADDM